MLQKEATIKESQKKLNKRKSVLKSLKTRLENSKKEIEETQFKVSGRMMGTMARMDELREEIADLANQLRNKKGFSREDKMQFGMLADEFTKEEMFGENFQEYKQRRAEAEAGNFNFDENERAKMRDMFEGLRVKPDEKEQRDIRKVFLKLSNKFHPDRATNKKEEAEFHEMQQKLNDAYQSGDIHTLLEMERLFLMEEIDLSEAKAYTVDVLDQAIKKLEEELQFIENQISRCQQEIKNLRNSDLGDMMAGMRRAKREGESLDDALEQMEEGITMLTKIRDGLKESLELGRFSPSLMKVLMENQQGMPDGLDLNGEEAELLAALMGEGGEEGLMDLFKSMQEEDYDDGAYEDAKYEPDQTVRITRVIGHPHLQKVKMKGFVGRVQDVIYNADGKLEYTVSLDSLALKELPQRLIKKTVEWDEDFQDVQVIERHLEACEPRDTEEDSIASYRTLFHKYNWDYTNKAQAKRLQDILLVQPEEDDQENWTQHLLGKVSYPFEAKTRGALAGDSPPNQKMKIFGAAGYNEEVGFIMNVKMGREKGTYPLMDLKAINKKSPVYDLLEDYWEWQDDYLEEEDEYLDQNLVTIPSS